MVERVGLFLLDVMWQIAIFGAIVLLLLMMTTWLVAGPWRLLSSGRSPWGLLLALAVIGWIPVVIGQSAWRLMRPTSGRTR